MESDIHILEELFQETDKFLMRMEMVAKFWRELFAYKPEKKITLVRTTLTSDAGHINIEIV